MGADLSKKQLSLTAFQIQRIIQDKLDPDNVRTLSESYHLHSDDKILHWVKSMNHKINPFLNDIALEVYVNKIPGSSIGYVTGDIRIPDKPFIKNHCTRNFYVDNKGNIWIIDVLNNRCYISIGTSTYDKVLL